MPSNAALFDDVVVLAPLTTVGNLPFRRLCKDYGADVTVSEMAVARNLLKRRRGERALLRHHPSERPFGVQLCGRHGEELADAARLAADDGADFVDLNVGCPIEAITRWGGGSALLRHASRVGRAVEAMVAAVDIPVTVKLRLGWSDDQPTALKVATAAVEAGACAVAIHGRSRAQRYRRPADWQAIDEVARALGVPVIGNGDLFTPADVAARRAATAVRAVMVARGALVKPWIFAEIRGGEELDPSSEDRFEMLRRYVAYGLEHFGDDAWGRAKVWGFLRDQLDFLYRYVPVGALDDPADRPGLQERRPAFTPRDELEALLASPEPEDHERICAMLLGDRPEGVAPRRAATVTG